MCKCHMKSVMVFFGHVVMISHGIVIKFIYRLRIFYVFLNVRIFQCGWKPFGRSKLSQERSKLVRASHNPRDNIESHVV